MPRLLYSFLFYLALPFLLFRLWWRGLKAPAYRKRWLERLGFNYAKAKNTKQPIWIHAVSVGETLAIVPLVKLLQARHPDIPIVMTTMTPTGAERVEVTFGEGVTHYYCPYDIPCAIQRFLTHLSPRGCVIVETELWPNLINACSKRNIPVLVANARLSERSAKGYARFGLMAEQMLQQIECIAVQNSIDGVRFLNLGVPPSSLEVTGSIKFDVKVPEGEERLAFALRELWGQSRPVLIGASTHEGEEAALLQAYQGLLTCYPELLLVVVPRHPERFDHVAELIKQQNFKLARRSLGQQPNQATQVYLGDTMGELMKLLAAADIAFIGGSLIERGGHNPLEPAVLRKPVLMGPHFYNFQLICDSLSSVGALTVISTADELAAEVKRLLNNPESMAKQGQAGYRFVQDNQGALEKLYALVDEICLRK